MLFEWCGLHLRYLECIISTRLMFCEFKAIGFAALCSARAAWFFLKCSLGKQNENSGDLKDSCIGRRFWRRPLWFFVPRSGVTIYGPCGLSVEAGAQEVIWNIWGKTRLHKRIQNKFLRAIEDKKGEARIVETIYIYRCKEYFWQRTAEKETYGSATLRQSHFGSCSMQQAKRMNTNYHRHQYSGMQKVLSLDICHPQLLSSSAIASYT